MASTATLTSADLAGVTKQLASPRIKRTQDLYEQAAQFEELAELLETKWDELNEDSRELVIHAAYASLRHQPQSIRDRYRQLRWSWKVARVALSGGHSALSAYGLSIARLNNAVLDHMEAEDAEYQRALSDAFATVNFDPNEGTLITSENARDYFRQLSRPTA